MKPTIGRIVLYVISEHDAAEINRRRATAECIDNRIRGGSWPAGAQAHIGPAVQPGEIFPAQVVRVHADPFETVNLKVNLDGTDQFWATSRREDDDKTPGTWHWMEYQKQQAGTAIGGPAFGSASGIAAITETTPIETPEPSSGLDRGDRFGSVGPDPVTPPPAEPTNDPDGNPVTEKPAEESEAAKEEASV